MGFGNGRVRGYKPRIVLEGRPLLAGDNLTIVLFFVGTAVSLACAAMSAAGWRLQF